jgi:hypothetical protein
MGDGPRMMEPQLELGTFGPTPYPLEKRGAED